MGIGRGQAGRGSWGSHGEGCRRHLHPGQGWKAGERQMEGQNLNMCRSKELPFSLWIAPISNMILNASQTQKSPRAVMFPRFCVGCFYNQERMQQACQEMSCPVWKRGRRVPFSLFLPQQAQVHPRPWRPALQDSVTFHVHAWARRWAESATSAIYPGWKIISHSGF